MANEWRELLKTVPDTLREACASSEEAIRLIDLAIVKLKAQQEAMRSYREGLAAGYVEPDPDGVLPLALLESARRDIKRCGTLEGLAEDVRGLCFARLGLVLSVEMVQRWWGGSAVPRNADEARLCLRNGASFAGAATDAVDMAAAAELPVDVVLRSGWLLAAEGLQNNAVTEVCLARNRVRAMRDALSLQVLDAPSILRLANE
jgi:hypothetical protein